MDDQDFAKLPDDFRVEITNLDGSSGQPGGWRPRFTPRLRQISLFATGVLFLLVVSLLINSISGVSSLIGQAFIHTTPATPDPVVPAGFLPVYLRGNPGWGQFILDGKAVVHPPAIDQGQPLLLAPGSHTVGWRAAPFKAETCMITVVAQPLARGACSLDNDTVNHFGAAVSTMIVAFFASLNDLSGTQRTLLTQQLQNVFASYDSNTQLQPGELYAVSEQKAQADPSLCRLFGSIALCYARADQPLLATLSLSIDLLTSNDDPCIVSGQCDINNQDCRVLCEDPVVDYSQQPVSGWSVYAMSSLQWSYRTPGGQLMADGQPDSAIRGTGKYLGTSIHIDRDAQGNWHITLFPATGLTTSTPACVQATNDTISALNVSFDNNLALYVQQDISDPAQMAAGCLTVAEQPGNAPGVTPAPSSTVDVIEPVSFLERFGVLLAVNASAHKICPGLPVASAYEQSIARNLLTGSL